MLPSADWKTSLVLIFWCPVPGVRCLRLTVGLCQGKLGEGCHWSKRGGGTEVWCGIAWDISIQSGSVGPGGPGAVGDGT